MSVSLDEFYAIVALIAASLAREYGKMISDILTKLLSGLMTFLFGRDKTYRRTI